MFELLRPPAPPQVRMLSARAAASFVLANESNSALLKHFADLLPGILQVRSSTSDSLDDDVN